MSNGEKLFDPAKYSQQAFVLIYLGTDHLGCYHVSDGSVLNGVTMVRMSILVASFWKRMYLCASEPLLQQVYGSIEELSHQRWYVSEVRRFMMDELGASQGMLKA